MIQRFNFTHSAHSNKLSVLSYFKLQLYILIGYEGMVEFVNAKKNNYVKLIDKHFTLNA